MQIPLMYELSKKKVLVIGGGKTALRLVKHIKEFYGSVSCVSKSFEPKFEDLKSVDCIVDIIRHNNINADYFENVDMVIAATSNTILNERIYKYCKENHKLCMTTHKNGPKDFNFMESIEKHGLLLAAYTGGASPTFSNELLQQFVKSMDEETLKRLELILDEKRLVSSLHK